MRSAIVGAVILFLLVPLNGHAQVAGVVGDWGWLSDGRRFAVGDIITVSVDEYTSASADRTTSAAEGRAVDIDVGGRVTGLADLSVDGGFESSLENESGRRGRDIRRDRLDSQVSVRVTEVEAGGMLRVEGTKSVIIDEHEQEVTVRGVIRPQDITADNMITSWRIAEVEVLYAVEGSLARASKSLIGRLFGWIVP